MAELIELTDDDLEAAYQRIMDSVPYDTPGQLRDAVFDGGPLCCSSCYEYTHEHAEEWREMEVVLWFKGLDWRTVE
jgi:hypothetical protein